MPKSERRKRSKHPWEGFANAAFFWLLAVLLFFSPEYVQFGGIAATVVAVLAVISLLISLLGVFSELGKLYQNRGLRLWGGGVVFLIPAVLLHLLGQNYVLHEYLEMVARIAVLVFIALSGLMFFQGVPYLLWNSDSTPGTDEQPSIAASDTSTRDWGRIWNTIASVIVGILTFATAVISLTTEVFQ